MKTISSTVRPTYAAWTRQTTLAGRFVSRMPRRAVLAWRPVDQRRHPRWNLLPRSFWKKNQWVKYSILFTRWHFLMCIWLRLLCNRRAKTNIKTNNGFSLAQLLTHPLRMQALQVQLQTQLSIQPAAHEVRFLVMSYLPWRSSLPPLGFCWVEMPQRLRVPDETVECLPRYHVCK